MSLSLVSDDLWEAIAPLLPKERPKPKGGRPRIPDRAALGGIVFVLRTGTAWRLLPTELGCGSGSTCWRRFHDWAAAGVWAKVHTHLLDLLGEEGLVNLDHLVVDSASVRAQKGGRTPAPTPPIAGRKAASGTC